MTEQWRNSASCGFFGLMLQNWVNLLDWWGSWWRRLGAGTLGDCRGCRSACAPDPCWWRSWAHNLCLRLSRPFGQTHSSERARLGFGANFSFGSEMMLRPLMIRYCVTSVVLEKERPYCWAATSKTEWECAWEWRWLSRRRSLILSHGVRSHVVTRKSVLYTLQEVCSVYTTPSRSVSCVWLDAKTQLTNKTTIWMAVRFGDSCREFSWSILPPVSWC